MPRGISTDALGSYGQNQATAQNAQQTLMPLYSRMAQSPQGFTPQQMAGFNTAAMQANGGAAAGAVGEGALAAARTNNAGAYQGAVDDAARSAAQNNAQDALGVQNQNANLMQRQQQMGLEGLQALYGTSTQAGLGYLNNALSADNATTSAAQGWTGLGINALAGGAMGAGALGYKPGCWIAEAIYGVDDLRTHTVRRYLNHEFRTSRFGNFVMRFYLRFGERTARFVRSSTVLKVLLRPLFDRALSSAIEVYGPGLRMGAR